MQTADITKTENINTNDNLENQEIRDIMDQGYQHGFVTDIETDTFLPGLDESVIRALSKKKNEPEFVLEWRLKAFEHWKTLKEPLWSSVKFPPIDYQALSYYSAPKQKPKLNSLDEVDPKLLETYKKLINIPFEQLPASIFYLDKKSNKIK